MVWQAIADDVHQPMCHEIGRTRLRNALGISHGGGEKREMAQRSRATDRLQQFQPVHALHGQGECRDEGLCASIASPLAQRAAQANCTLLITGETGVGKGYLARWIHEHSPRRSGPFVPVNCGAIPESLVDSQLFGHARGAFSGATHDHLGLVRAAEKGCLLLDEISELPPSAQSRLLRLLQEREVQPVGYSQPVIVDVRVIAATNVDLKRAVNERRFREDLLFRLDVIRLHVKPLRQRPDEILHLVESFNRELAQLYRQPELQFDESALALLRRYHWPGNIRQVRSLVERLHVLCHDQVITAAHVIEIGELHDASPSDQDGMSVLHQIKRDRLRQILADANGSVVRAAAMFGVHRSTIYRWLRGG